MAFDPGAFESSAFETGATSPIFAWSYQVDGVELNDPDRFGTVIVPEIDNGAPYDVVLVPIDGDYPTAVRLQAKEGPFTIAVTMGAVTPAAFRSRLADLRSVLTPGAHVLYCVARGATPRRVRLTVKGSMADYRNRVVAFQGVATEAVS